MKQKKTPPEARRLKPTSIQQQFLLWLSRFNHRLTVRYQGFLARRPHRSFRRTYRRDYQRSLTLPGYVAFSHHVTRTLIDHKKTFTGLIVLSTLAALALGGITNQETYTQISDLMKQSTQNLSTDGVDKLAQAGLLLAATVSGGNANLAPDQQLYMVFVVLMTWLVTVWLLREFMVGRRPRLRDGLYNAGAPVISTIAVLMMLAVQLLPIGIVALAYAGLTTVGLATEGFGAMLFWVSAATVSALILYWITSTLLALVIVTLPGMYPLRAMKAASDLVVGRRLRILYRWLWGMLMVILWWAVIIIPIILLDGWLGGVWSWVNDIPIVPIAATIMSTATAVWFAAYVYLLYRRIVDE